MENKKINKTPERQLLQMKKKSPCKVCGIPVQAAAAWKHRQGKTCKRSTEMKVLKESMSPEHIKQALAFYQDLAKTKGIEN